MRLYIILFFLFPCWIIAVPYEIDLSGGTGGGYQQSVYTAPNGTVVTSSAISYANSDWYLIKNMFNNTFGTAGDSYWLPNTGATTTLALDLDQLYYLTQIRIFVNTQYSHHSTRYQLEVSGNNGLSYTNISAGYLNAGTYSDITWNISGFVDYVRLTVQTTSTWMCINEIELFADNAMIPEPSSLLLAGFVLLGIFISRKFF